jgi:alkylated DNA repair dioxygenase AlkB
LRGIAGAGSDGAVIGASGSDLGAIGAPLLERGWVRLRRHVAPDDCAALRDRGGHPWRPLAEQVGVVRQAGWYCQPSLDELPPVVQAFADALFTALRPSFDGLAFPARFNEVTWQRHTPDAGFVGPHRDQSFYTGVIAVVTLLGAARFSILASREPRNETASWVTEPGDLVVLRGAGLGSPDARGPWHDVGPPSEGERETLTLRHTIRTPGGWE